MLLGCPFSDSFRHDLCHITKAEMCGWQLPSAVTPLTPPSSAALVAGGLRGLSLDRVQPQHRPSLGSLQHLAPHNMGSWIQKLPPLSNGLVTVKYGADDDAELLLAALLRDGCCVIGDAVSAVRCAFFYRYLRPRMPLDPTHVRLKRACV
jgi:hypothetical protein